MVLTNTVFDCHYRLVASLESEVLVNNVMSGARAGIVIVLDCSL